MYVYIHPTDQINNYACVHTSFGRKFFQLTPFGDWSLQIHDPSNNLDLSGVDRVEIYFVGTAIKTNTYRPSVSGNKYEVYGEKPRSKLCSGSGRVAR